MRDLLAAILILILAAVGCARGRIRGPDGSGTGTKTQHGWVTPGHLLVGKVARVNLSARIAILNFPVGHLPALDQHLSVYRQGLKVGEIKVSGPQLDDNIVGDILAGEARPGDEVRDR